MRSISIAVGLSLLSTVLAQRKPGSNCYNGYCCSGTIVGDCTSKDISKYICCVGDVKTNFICAADGALTCSAGVATPLASAAGSPTSSTATTPATSSPTSPTTSISQTGSSTSSPSPSTTDPSTTAATTSKSAPATSPTGNAAANVFGAMPGQMAFKMMAAAINAF